MAELVFSTQRRDFEKGRHYQNPQYFDGRFPKGTSHVYVLGDWPKVVEAAEDQEINVTQLRPGAPISWKDGIAPVEPGQALVEIPDTWKHFGNQRIIELAAAIAQRDVANRKQAVRIIEDELDRRVIVDEHDTPAIDDETHSPEEEVNSPVGDDSSGIEPAAEEKQEAPSRKNRRGKNRK